MRADNLNGVQIVAAAAQVLARSGGQPQTTGAITAALNRAGLAVSREQVGAILARAAHHGDAIVHVGRGLWAVPMRHSAPPDDTVPPEHSVRQAATTAASQAPPDVDQPPPAAASAAGQVASVSFMITRAQKVQLRELGYSDEQIALMRPAEAHRILALAKP